MSVWLHYWHERCIRAERDCCDIAATLHRCMIVQHCAYSDDDQKTVTQWALKPPRELLPSSDEIREWADRAGIAETASDEMALLLQRCDATDYQRSAALQRYYANRDRRYGALPSGPTLQGNLASGGVTEF